MMKYPLLPEYASIFGDTHFPPVDNQGGIGSCASQSITRNQFTNAVSRLLHEADPDSDFCPRDDFAQAFTPKYSYDMAGPGTAWVYEFIRDHGALFQTEGIFEKSEAPEGVLGGSVPRGKDGKPSPQSASFLVGKGQMEKALCYRVRSFDQIWFTKPPYNERLTTSEDGLKLLSRIKRAIVSGEAVVTGGYPGRWVFSDVTGCGNLARRGERACVAAAGNGGGGHQVTIVGYDDGVSARFAGVTLRGAFLIMNSYGPGWMNGGLCWMMYDAVNTRSQYEELNDASLYSGPMHLTPGDSFRMFPPSLTEREQTLYFSCAGSCQIHGKTYPAFRVKDPKSGKCIGYHTDSPDRALFLCEEKKAPRFAPVPYEDVLSFPGAKEEYRKEAYAGSVWLYAVDRADAPDGYCVLDAGVSYGASGRTCALASHNAARYPEAKSWLIDAPPEGSFLSKLTIAAGRGEKSERIWTLDQFCFIDRRKDVAIGMPERYFKVTVRATDRDCFRICVTRKNKKSGSVRKYLPAMFAHISSRPFFAERKKGDYLNFDGILRGPECEGELAFSAEHLIDRKKGERYDDFIWGLELRKGRSGKASLVSASLMDADKKEISRAKGDRRKLLFE